MQIYAYLLTPPNFSYIYNNIAPFFYYIIMELLLETTKGKIAISATFPFLFNCGLLSTFAQRVGWSTFNFHLAIRLMQLVVPRAVSAAVRMDTTT